VKEVFTGASVALTQTDGAAVGRLVEEVGVEYDERGLIGTPPVLVDLADATSGVRRGGGVRSAPEVPRRPNREGDRCGATSFRRSSGRPLLHQSSARKRVGLSGERTVHNPSERGTGGRKGLTLRDPLEEPAPARRGSSGVTGDLWDTRRWRLFDALAQQSELFADLYRRAVDALNERPLRHGALVVAAHCIRDLVNGLPDVITDAGEVPAHMPLSQPAQELASTWSAYPIELGPIDTPISAGPATQGAVEPLMTVPVALVEAARQVAHASRAATENARRRRSALVLGRMEATLDPTVRIFQESVTVFEKVRHPRRGREVDIEDVVPRVREALVVIETALEARLGSFFQTVEDLMDVLTAANERTEV
jgi:hypothetical protein